MLLSYVKLVGAIIACANENDRKAAAKAVCDRDFNLSDPVSRKAFIAWLEDLTQKLQADNTVTAETARTLAYTDRKQSLIFKISKMTSFVRDDVADVISKNRKPFYSFGEGIGKASA